MLLDLGSHLETFDARRDDERGVAAGLQVSVDLRDDHMDLGDPSIRRPRLLPVQNPFVLGLVVASPRAQ